MTALAAVTRLAGLLAQENAALQAMDLATAGRLLNDKLDAASALQTARAAAREDAALRTALAGLQTLAAENRRLLERAIKVQGRVIGLLAHAARTQDPAPRYGRSGAYAARSASAWTLSARA